MYNSHNLLDNVKILTVFIISLKTFKTTPYKIERPDGVGWPKVAVEGEALLGFVHRPHRPDRNVHLHLRRPAPEIRSRVKKFFLYF